MNTDRNRLLAVVSRGLHDLLAERGAVIRTDDRFVMTGTRRKVVNVLRSLAPPRLRTSGVPALASSLADRIEQDKSLADRIEAAAGVRLTGARPGDDSPHPLRGVP